MASVSLCLSLCHSRRREGGSKIQSKVFNKHFLSRCLSVSVSLYFLSFSPADSLCLPIFSCVSLSVFLSFLPAVRAAAAAAGATAAAAGATAAAAGAATGAAAGETAAAAGGVTCLAYVGQHEERTAGRD